MRKKNGNRQNAFNKKGIRENTSDIIQIKVEANVTLADNVTASNSIEHHNGFGNSPDFIKKEDSAAAGIDDDFVKECNLLSGDFFLSLLLFSTFFENAFFFRTISKVSTWRH